MAQLERYSGAVLSGAGLVVRDREEGAATAAFGDLSQYQTTDIRLPVIGVRGNADSINDDSGLSDCCPEIGKGMVTMVVAAIRDDQ